MNATVQAALTAGLAGLTETATLPEPPYGYGCDISCESDIDPRMDEVDESALVLAQHCLRRLDTPTGLPDDDDWGLSISDYCNRPTTRQELYALEGEIVAELVDDDRVDEVHAAVESSTDCFTLTVSLRIVPLDPLADDFSLTLSVSNAGVLLEEMTT
jgi:hypothetical protein